MHAPNKIKLHPAQAAIRCELTDSDIASALGIEIHSRSPVLALCRALVEAGHDPGTPMTCWRGDVECLRIASIGAGARLEVAPHGVGFRIKPGHEGRIAPLVAPLGNSDPEAAKAAKKLTRTAKWMADHPNDEPCPKPNGSIDDYQARRAAREWRKARGIILEPGARKQRAKYLAAMGRAP